MNLKETEQKIDKWLDSEKGKESIMQWEKEMMNEHALDEKYLIKIKNIIDKGLDISFLSKLLKWEDNYEERLYQKGIQGSSMIFDYIVKFFTKYGIDVEDEKEETFLSIYVKYDYYKMKVYQGQGCFIRLYFKDEEIFQSN